MKEGLEEFLKRIEAKPTNETLIDRFVTLVLEEDVLERILYLKKLVGLLLTPNPYAALKAAALELQEARKERLTKEYEVGALKDVESCFLKLEKMENVALVREEINKLQSDMGRESTVTRARTPPPTLPQSEPEEEARNDVPLPLRQPRMNFRTPAPDLHADDHDDDRTAQHRPGDAESLPPSPPRSQPQTGSGIKAEPFMSANPGSSRPMDADYSADRFGYVPGHKAMPAEPTNSYSSRKEFYDKNLEETDDRPEETTRRSSLSRISGLNASPKLQDPAELREPPRPRSMPSAFESNDVFGQKEPANPASAAQTSEKSGRAAKESTKTRSRVIFDPEDYAPDSNAIFQESQQVHFPESTSQRSMTRQDARSKASAYDVSNSAVAPSPLENTEILPDSNLMSAPIPYDDEATTQLDPEELMRSQMPVEPAFPPREFDVPPFEFAAQKEAKAAPPAKTKAKDPFAGVRQQNPLERESLASGSSRDSDLFAPSKAVQAAPSANPPRDPFAKAREPLDPFAGLKEATLAPASAPQARDPFSGMREPPAPRDPIPFPKDVAEPRSMPMAPAPSPAPSIPTPAPAPKAQAAAPATEPRWSLLRDRLRLLSGIQISRSQAGDFVLRLLGENSSREEQQEFLSILMRVLEGPRQPLAEQRFLAFLFEELQPKALHQLLGALKIGDQTVAFFVDYLQSLLKERQLRRMLNVIHAVILPGLDLSWYQESYRFLIMIWPELGLKGWHWLEEEGPMVFCDRLAEREDLLPATLLA